MPREGRYMPGGRDKVGLQRLFPLSPRELMTRERGYSQRKRSAAKRYQNPDSRTYFFPKKNDPRGNISRKRRSV